MEFKIAVSAVHQTPVVAAFDSDFVEEINTYTASEHKVEVLVFAEHVLGVILFCDFFAKRLTGSLGL